MFLSVVIPRPIDKIFMYRCPEAWIPNAQPGMRVRVPFGRQEVTGFIVGMQQTVPEGQETPGEEFREVLEILEILDSQPVITEEMIRLSQWLATYYLCPWGVVLKTMLPEFGKSRRPRKAKSVKSRPPTSETERSGTSERPVLNTDQKRCCDEIQGHLASTSFAPMLLHGVTGSGKTEVYLLGAEAMIHKGVSCLVLVPEISLTSQIVSRFRQRFRDRVFLYHSGLTAAERREAWLAAQQGDVDVVIGTRSAVFLPFPRLGLVIVDEEHDGSYKQEEGLRYHARDVAIYRAKACGAAVLLGSATPSLESYYHVSRGKYRYLHLPNRVDHRALPLVRVIDLRRKDPKITGEGNRPPDRPDKVEAAGSPRPDSIPGLFSPALEAALQDRLSKGEQSLLFLNRRGFFPYLLCEDCGHSPTCPNCSLSLSYHRQEDRLRCHTCDFWIRPMSACSECQGSRIQTMGMGTERVESEVRRLFPEARILRMDRDTTRKKQSHHKMLDQMEQREADVLIGTQMITKGLDFPHITLVGIVLADTGFHIPDFRSAERSFQLLTQVSGRAGRGSQPGEVILQTYNPSHPAIRFASHHDYEGFAQMELASREGLGFPPYQRLARLLVMSSQMDRVEVAAQDFARGLKSCGSPGEELLGPAPAPLFKIRGWYRWQIVLKYASPAKARKMIQKGMEGFFKEKSSRGIRIDVDVDAQNLL